MSDKPDRCIKWTLNEFWIFDLKQSYKSKSLVFGVSVLIHFILFSRPLTILFYQSEE
jgi:hypothetical protein